MLSISFLTELNMETPRQVLCGLGAAIAAGVGAVAIMLGLAVFWPAAIDENFGLILLGLFVILWWGFFLAFAGFGKGS